MLLNEKASFPVAVILAALYYRHAEHHPSSDDAYVEADVVGIVAQVAGPVVNLAVVDNQASFTFALTTLACPLRGQMVEQAKAEVAKLDAQLELSVNLVEMSEQDKQKLLGKPGEDEKPLAERLNDISHVVAVMSGKGGVGKSSVAAQLASASPMESLRKTPRPLRMRWTSMVCWCFQAS